MPELIGQIGEVLQIAPGVTLMLIAIDGDEVLIGIDGPPDLTFRCLDPPMQVPQDDEEED